MKYHDIESYPKDSVKLGCWLGVAHSVGSAMTYWILKENGMIIPRSTVRPLTDEETRDPIEIKTHAKYDEIVVTKFGEYDPDEQELFENDDMEEPRFPEDDDMTDDVIEHDGDAVRETGTQEGKITVMRADENEVKDTVRETSAND